MPHSFQLSPGLARTHKLGLAASLAVLVGCASIAPVQRPDPAAPQNIPAAGSPQGPGGGGLQPGLELARPVEAPAAGPGTGPAVQTGEAAASGELPWLGIAVRPAPDGVEVERVFRGSPAFAQGVAVGDRLLTIDGEAIATLADFRRITGESVPGQRRALGLQRAGKVRLVPLLVAKRPSTVERLRQHYIGYAAPSISTGKAIQGALAPSLQALRGRVVVLDFWGAWCGPCQVLTPQLNTWHATQRAVGLTVLGITLDPFEQASIDARQLGLEYPLFWDEGSNISDAYSAYSLPLVYAIDKQGNVADLMLGVSGPELKRFAASVERLLAAE